MLSHKLLLQRSSHTLRPSSLSPLYRAPLRTLPSKPTPLLRLTRAYSQAPKPTTSTTITSNNLPPKSQRAASQALYPPPDKTKKYLFPDRLPIYHAGTGRVLFLAVLKLTTIVLSAVFCGVLVPAYIAGDKPWWQTAGLAVAGVIPLLFVAYTTAPFATHIHIYLPPSARLSRPSLERFVSSLPPQTRLQATTLSLIAKPRVSYFTLGELHPARRRMGIVNYARDVTAENRARKWYMFRAVAGFNVQGTNRGVKEGWVWDAVREKVKQRAR